MIWLFQSEQSEMYLENFIQREIISHLLFNKTSRKHILWIRNRKGCEEKLSKITREDLCNATHRSENKLSKKERRVDALALRADERRDKLRKASVRSKYPMIRRYLNGETRLRRPQSSIRQSITYRREPGELKHLSSRRKRKKHRFCE